MERKFTFSLRKVKGGLASMVVASSLFGASALAYADETTQVQTEQTQDRVVTVNSAESEVAQESVSNQSSDTNASEVVDDSEDIKSSEINANQEVSPESPAVSEEVITKSVEAPAKNEEILEQAVPANNSSSIIGTPKTFVEKDGNWYYIGENGQNVTGSQTVDGKQMYFREDGIQVKGDFATDENGQKHYYDPNNGIKQTHQFIDVNGTFYYVDDNGDVVTGRATIDNQNLYFNADGSQVKDGFGQGSDGKKRYYDANDGRLQSQRFLNYDGDWYYLTEDGSVATGNTNVNGQQLYFREDGRQVKGEFVTVDGKTTYYDPFTGDLLVNTKRTINGVTYVFNGRGEAKEAKEILTQVTKTSIQVDSYEFGPAVSKVVLQFNQLVTPAVVHANATVALNGLVTNILNSYVSDATGHVVFFDSSYYVTLEMEVRKMGQNASPFVYNGTNQWVSSYPVKVSGLQVQVDGAENTQIISSNMEAIGNRFMPRLDAFSERGKVNGFNYAAFTPQNAQDGEKNPLIVWVHGMGEVGSDITIPLLAADVAKLTENQIQSHFTSTGTGSQRGAYVLAIQSPTFLGVNNMSSAIDVIKDYVKNHPDIDQNRIYLAGASMGGAVTLGLGISNPGYFAALVPISAPTDTRMTNNQVSPSVYEAIKDTPMWFIQTATDTTVAPDKNVLPFYKSLLNKGANNKWLSYFETNESTFSPGETYNGHWSWVYFFNDQVTGVQNVENTSTWDGYTGMVATNPYHGGDAAAVVEGKSYRNVFDWLNDQHKNR